MQSAAGPPGGSNPKRATGRSHRSADGASPAALDRSPRDVARPAHAHGLASTATFGGAICAFIALWIVLAPIGLLPTVGGAHSVHFESDSLFGRHALRRKVAAGCPRRASQLPARTAASSSRPASTSTRSSFCRCVLVASRAAVKVCPDERQAIVPSLFALCMSGQAAAGHDHRATLLQPDLSHCAQPPEHHHRPASCHGELLLHPFARLSLALAHFGLPLLAFGELFSALLPRCRRHTPSGRPEPRGLDLSPSLVHAALPAQSSWSIRFLMLLGSSLTLCDMICHNTACSHPSKCRIFV